VDPPAHGRVHEQIADSNHGGGSTMNAKRSTLPKGGCVHTLLIRGHQHEVTYCSCGNVHVTWGSVTLRMMPDDFAALSESLVEAAGALAEATREPEVPPAGRLLV